MKVLFGNYLITLCILAALKLSGVHKSRNKAHD